MDQTVVLADIEWQQLLAILCNGTGLGISWATTNPLVMKIGSQLQAQQGQAPGHSAGMRGDGQALDLDPPQTRRPARQ